MSQHDSLTILFLVIALLALYFARRVKHWLVKLILFFASLGAVSLFARNVGANVFWSLVLYIVVFLVVGIDAIKKKDDGNRVMGFILTGLGILLIIPTVNSIGSDASGTALDVAGGIFRQGFAAFGDVLDTIFNGA